jgi:hypothetical protein
VDCRSQAATSCPYQDRPPGTQGSCIEVRGCLGSSQGITLVFNVTDWACWHLGSFRQDMGHSGVWRMVF